MFEFDGKELASVLLGGSALIGSIGLSTEQIDSNERGSVTAEARVEESELRAQLVDIIEQDKSHAAEIAEEVKDLRDQAFIFEKSSEEALAEAFRGKEKLEQHEQVLDRQAGQVTELSDRKDTLQSKVNNLGTAIAKTQKATASEARLLKNEESRTRELAKDAARLQDVVEDRQERVENLQIRKQDLERRVAKKRAEEKAAKERYEERRRNGEIGADRH